VDDHPNIYTVPSASKSLTQLQEDISNYLLLLLVS